jgi:hypothetical protein
MLGSLSKIGRVRTEEELLIAGQNRKYYLKYRTDACSTEQIILLAVHITIEFS